MSIQTVLGKIQLSTDEPFRERRFPFEHFPPTLPPQKLACLARPELVRGFDRFAIHPPVLREILDPRLLRELLRRLKNALLLQERFNVFVVDLHLTETNNRR